MDGMYGNIQQPMNFNDLFMAQNMGMQPQAPSPMMPQQQPMAGPQNVQMTPEMNHINDVISQYTQNKQAQQENSGLVQQILSNRMQPTTQDAAQSVNQTAQSFLTPNLFQPQTPGQAMDQRYATQLAPYTQGLSLAGQSAGLTRENMGNAITAQTGMPLAMAQLQKAQTENQYAGPEAEAKIAALRAQAGIFNSPNGGATPGQPQLSGDQFLQTLNPQQAAQVKALAEGRMQFPAGFALKSPYWQQMISAVSQYDPNFDAVNFNSRANTRKSFTSGADANNITALNTAMSHLGTLSGNYDKLDNTRFPAVNATENYLGNALGFNSTQTNTANVSSDAEAVAHELAKVFRSTGMSEGEINAWKDKINTSASPAQSKAVIGSALDLIDGRLSALGEKYNQGMGTTKQPLELLSPDAQKAYNGLRGLGSNQPQAQQPQQNEFQEGRIAVGPNGQKLIVKDGNLVPLQ